MVFNDKDNIVSFDFDGLLVNIKVRRIAFVPDNAQSLSKLLIEYMSLFR
jgi:hypothetical protein